MRRLALITLFLCLPAALHAQPTPQGAEFQVNTSAEYFYRPSVDYGSDGRFVVMWAAYTDTSDYFIFGRRYQSDGTVLGAQFRADLSATAAFTTDISFAADDSFMVVWDNNNGVSDFDIVGRLFASDGTPQGGELAINAWTTADQGIPSISRAGNRFVVVWQSLDQDGDDEGIFGRLFDSAGGAIGNDFQVNTITTDGQVYPAVAAAPDGRFIVSWLEISPDEVTTAVSARRYASDGSPIGAQFVVDSSGSPSFPSVAVGSDGRFVVAYGLEPSTELTPGIPNKVLPPDDGIYAQRFLSDGSPNGGPISVETTNTTPFRYANVSMDPSDRFLITWGSGSAVRGQRYASNGAPVEGEFQTTSSGTYPTSAVNPAGDGFILIWNNTGGTEVRGQLYGGTLPVTLLKFSVGEEDP